MILYLLTVLVLQVLTEDAREDCWVFAKKIDYGNGNKDNVETFEDCVKACKDIFKADCFYVMYIPATKKCEFENSGGYVIDSKLTGYTFSSRECSKDPIGADPATCRVKDVSTEYTGGESYKRSYGTIVECDAFCLSFDWCAASLWWGGTEVTAESQGYCQTTDSSNVKRFFTAELSCLDSGDPCSAGKVLDEDYGCVEDTTAPATTPPPTTSAPVPDLIVAKSKKVKCKAGRRCKVKFVLSPPDGLIITKKKIRVCKMVGDKLVDCTKKVRLAKNVVTLKLTGDDFAGDYIGYVLVDGEKVLSDISRVFIK